MEPWPSYSQLVLNLLLSMVNLLLALRLTSRLKGEIVMLRLLQGHSLCVNLLVLALV